jgi:hypothetical protein
MSFDVQGQSAYRLDRWNFDPAHAAMAQLCGGDLSDHMIGILGLAHHFNM